MLADILNGPSFPEAKCADGNITGNWDRFFPDYRVNQDGLETEAELIKICHGCIHRTDCLNLALENQETEGIWGGTTPGMRKEMLKNIRKRKARFVRVS